MSTENTHTETPEDENIRLTREQKDALQVKLDYLEQIEAQLASGELDSPSSEKLLVKTLAEIDEIMQVGRNQGEACVKEKSLEEDDDNELKNESQNQVHQEVGKTETRKFGLDETIANAHVLLPAEAQATERTASENLNWDELNNLQRLSTNGSQSEASAQIKKLSKDSGVRVNNQEDTSSQQTREKNSSQNQAPKKKVKAKPKLRVPTKRPKLKAKKNFPLGTIIVLIFLGSLAYYYRPIIDFVKAQQAAVAHKPQVKKEKPKAKPKVIVKKVEVPKPV
jgi:hypothetical protein